ncbi:YhcN/YlaJ family sporulation lipoprotein [Bacillus sp. ISL-47]|uniref:YhcN/YlaJ family sporulation lipoprotein n=1 Tax=Bacillus sp. ISL-47 TaxID=2819130 RepID=UPI001BECA590|nr:YhcN/YlaJ family sporulation lipoprotein [Bacillus sp. ISL-47]MBT2691210.1 YhcN/YlaJ family sporulation lipoprotein [Bacillus sp. ISL-47]MBT2709902.1 YhcN/YlaJ family sporulation lipoprotein [Pseudomonas sp. ISL-84]
MLKRKAILAGALTAVVLAGCGMNDTDMNETAQRNRDLSQPTKVNDSNYGENGRTTEPGIDLTRTRTENQKREQSPRMRVADKAAEKITAIPEVETANVIVTDNNAYVAARLDNGNGKLTRDIEGKIADQVKSVDQDIDNVYVSVNPDFYDRMTGYTDDIRGGQPVEGFFDEFNETVRRIFPTQR